MSLLPESQHRRVPTWEQGLCSGYEAQPIPGGSCLHSGEGLSLGMLLDLEGGDCLIQGHH